MKKIMSKRSVLSYLLVFVILFASFPNSVFAMDIGLSHFTIEDNSSQQDMLSPEREAFFRLIEERIDAFSREIVSVVEVNRIDRDLISMGANFIPDEQARAIFSASPMSRGMGTPQELTPEQVKALTSPQVQTRRPPNLNGDNGTDVWITFQTYVNFPNENWTGLSTYNFVDILLFPSAGPNGHRSRWHQTGTAIVPIRTSAAADSFIVLRNVSLAAAGEVPIISQTISAYNLLRGMPHFNRASVVNGQQIAYTWNSVQTNVFTYVNRQGAADHAFRLSLISTRAEVLVDVRASGMMFSDQNGITRPLGSIGFDATIDARPASFGADWRAIEAFRTGRTQYSTVRYSNIYGPDGRSVVTLRFPVIASPAH